MFKEIKINCDFVCNKLHFSHQSHYLIATPHIIWKSNLAQVLSDLFPLFK